MKIWEILKEENVGKKVKSSNGIEYRIALGGKDDVLLFESKHISCELFSQIEIMTLDFEFIQQPVTFEEVLNSDKKCRVEHEIFKSHLFKEDVLQNDIIKMHKKSILNNKYMFIQDIMYVFGYVFVDSDLKKVIREGKWYLEP